jgi:hypothetical protein
VYDLERGERDREDDIGERERDTLRNEPRELMEEFEIDLLK